MSSGPVTNRQLRTAFGGNSVTYEMLAFHLERLQEQGLVSHRATARKAVLWWEGNGRSAIMSGKLPIDRVREHDRANQAKKERAKQQVAQDQATVEQRARTYDDLAATRALEAGESPPGDDSEADAKDS